MPKVFITRKIPGPAQDLLKNAGFEVVVNPDDRVLTKDGLKKAVAGVDAILSLLSDHIDSEVMDAAGKQLKIIANYAVGFDNIDIEAAKQRGIFVTNTPGVLTEAVAEHTFALLMAATRRIVESDRFTREGKYKQWEPFGFIGPQVWGKTIGIIGLGRIGSWVGMIAFSGFRMKILYYDVKRNPEFEMENQATFAQIDQILPQADFITIHVPLLPETKHLINDEKLKLMKNSAILVNTSRGPVVDENALVQALKNGTIAAAALDVFENEPNLADGLVGLPNAILTPHIASATKEAREAMSKIAAENIIAALTGVKPPSLVY